MTAPEPTAVERTIATEIHRARCAVDGCELPLPSDFDDARAAVAAIRNLPPDQMAELSPAVAQAWDEGGYIAAETMARWSGQPDWWEDEPSNPYRREVTP